MTILVGCSGWSYPDWQATGSVYAWRVLKPAVDVWEEPAKA